MVETAVDGVLVIDKPPGITSHDVVDEVRRRLATKKVGHGGTLDPEATGILMVGVGRATRFLEYSQRAPKRYTAVGVFGITTSTQDASGEIIEVRPAEITRADVERVAGGFVGEIDQVPPMVSAVKIGGERLYKKARRGEEVERAARRVTIHELTVTDFDPDGPRATFDVLCSSGTYVRTLVNDLGEALGCGAHLESLRRVAAGGFSIDEAIALEEVTPGSLRPLADAVRDLPAIHVTEEDAERVGHGRDLPAVGELEDGACVAVHLDDRLLAVYRRKGERLVPDRVLGS
ncbi:MAG TPA: tRNA pseudouridine(55) synthase TruB [Actinomycetota bacterium]|nr:tRNA pseudouridine(55) synthase TruB [Actinomycetota bacterium]